MTSFAHTPTAEENRLRKATALVTFLDDVRVLRWPLPNERRSVELAADVPRCSDLTWQLAAQLWCSLHRVST